MTSGFYPHMPIYRLVFVILIVFCLYGYDFSTEESEDKASGVNFARRFVGVQGRKSPIWGNFAPLEATPRSPKSDESVCALGSDGAGDAGVRTGHA